MTVPTRIDPIDYLVIGHLTCDLVSHGWQLGGTVAYSALTAKALGLRPGIVTSCRSDLDLSALAGIPVINFPAEENTTFENVITSDGRMQRIGGSAHLLGYHNIPETWRSATIIHLGPVAQEVEPSIIRSISAPLIGVTPQGWLRAWDSDGRISPTDWPEAVFVLQKAGAVVLSVEDVDDNEALIDEFASTTPILAVTESHLGCRIYWNGDVRRFRPPKVVEIDADGAGDIYATAFFTRLYTTRDPWEAARFATSISAFSTTRSGLLSIPTPDEIETCLVEVF